MNPLIIESTDTTLQVNLNKSTGVFEFSGRSRPEDIVRFFKPIFDWFKEYESDPNPETVVTFKMDYFNSSSAKVLLRFLVFIEDMFNKGINIRIKWCYVVNDDDMLETGEDYSTLIKVPFEFEEIE